MRRGPEPEESEGIVIGRTDYGERDRVVRLLTPDHGRLSLMAKGARGSKPRFSALDLGARVRWAARPGQGLRNLVDAEILDGRIRLRASLGRLALAAYAGELCGALAREEHSEPRLYGLLEMALLVLDAADADPGLAFVVGLEAKALTFAGVGPALDRCAACGADVETSMVFVPAGGGLRHPRCAADDDGPVLPVSEAWARAVQAARRAPLRDLLDTGLPPGPTNALALAVAAHLGRALPSRAVWEALIH